MAIEIRNEVLTSLDVDKLKKTKLTFIGVSVFCVFFVSIALSMMSDMFSGFKFEFPEILFALFPLLFVAIPGFMVWYVYRTWRRSQLDIALGTKEILKGCISGKRMSVSSGKNGSRRRSYYLSLENEEELTVDVSQYNKVEEGDIAEIYRGVHSKVILDIKNFTQNETRAKAEDLYSKIMNPETAQEAAIEIIEEQRAAQKTETKSLTKEDNDFLMRLKSKKMNALLLTMALVFGGGGVYFEFIGTIKILSTFFYPFVLLSIVFLYRNVFKGLFTFLRLSKAISTGTKKVKYLKVLKRENYSNTGTLCYIKFQGDLRIKVKKEVYDYLKVNDVVEVGFVKERFPFYFKKERANPVYHILLNLKSI